MVGAVAEFVGLNLSFILPLAFCLLAVVLAGIVTPAPGARPRPTCETPVP